jgi:hypothetical protein
MATPATDSPLPNDEILEADVVGESETTPPQIRELLAIALLVTLADITIYRGHGYAGLAALLILTPPLLAAGAPRPRFSTAARVLFALLCLLALRLVWYGSLLQIFAGAVLLLAFAAALAGLAPGFIPLSLFASLTLPAGFQAFRLYWRSIQNKGPRIPRGAWLNIALPLAALITFSALFVLANPDVVTFLGRNANLFLRMVRNWIIDMTLRPTEILFWLGVAWISAGLLRPIIDHGLIASERPADNPFKPTPAPLYAACRNTLYTVIALFAVYLAFEFTTLWFREFPEGFYYAGYAHEGAAWLTVALALATVILSVVFRGTILRDPRLGSLRRLAWIWSAENVLLAIAVYNRLMIYVGFNGMTRMRIVGFFGITAVVAGFVLVVWKIAREKDFAWLIRRQSWALALTIYVFALTPVDSLAVSYNVRRILRGDPAASMQIGVQSLDTEGILAVTPLLNCQDGIIREGVKALLARHAAKLEASQARSEQYGWTTTQLAERVALAKLNRLRSQWAEYQDPDLQREMLQRFYDYAYQWY